MTESPVKMVADGIRAAVQLAPTDANVDQVIADAIAALWPAQPQGATA